jgi:hypothetical protein
MFLIINLFFPVDPQMLSRVTGLTDKMKLLSKKGIQKTSVKKEVLDEEPMIVDEVLDVKQVYLKKYRIKTECVCLCLCLNLPGWYVKFLPKISLYSDRPNIVIDMSPPTSPLILHRDERMIPPTSL